jgi:diaminohydroxyphosphoribosylaminopyrimidine deaminase/5-amino-6-(5-phosphoribosylamino)uracil reductase
MQIAEDERRWMLRAIELAAHSVAEPDREDVTPNVGAVLIRDGQLLGEGYRGATAPPDHAEFGLLEKQLAGVDLLGATLFVTLEPCSRRGPHRTPCAIRIADRGISTVWIGGYDPNPKITREGWRILDERGVRLRDFPADLRALAASANKPFDEQYEIGRGDRGSARFDYTRNHGQFPIEDTSAGSFVTAWTPCSPSSIYAIDNTHLVRQQRYATRFDQIDDPSQFDRVKYTLPIAEAEIVIFTNGSGHLLVRVDDVLSPPTDDRWELAISWEIRTG